MSTRIVFALSLIAVLGVTLTAHAGPFAFEDNFDDGNDDGWTRFDFSSPPFVPALQPWGPGVFDPSGGDYDLSTTGVVTVGGPGGGLLLPVRTDSIANPAAFSNGFVRATVTAGTQGTAMGIAMRADLTTLASYAFNASTNAGTFELVRLDPGLQEVLLFKLDETVFPFNPGDTWNIEAGAVGDTLSFKVWRPTDPEPAQPQMSITDSTYSQGSLALFAQLGFGAQANAAVDATFDNVRFQDVPEPTTAILFGLMICTLGIRTKRE